MACRCRDFGGTKSVEALYGDDGRELGRASTGPGALSRGSDATLAVVRSLWAELAGLGASMSGTDLAIGLAGIGLRDQVG